MARVTVEDCLAQVPNRFALTVLAARRARMLSEGRGRPLVECENKEGVTALREIAAGGVRYQEEVDEIMRSFIVEKRRQFHATVGDWSYVEAAALTGVVDEEEELDVVPAIEELPAEPEKLSSEAKSMVAEDAEATESTGDDEVPEAEPDVGDDEVIGAIAGDAAALDEDDDE